MDRITSGKRLRIPIKASVCYVFAACAAKLIGIASTAAFTRIMSGEEYGAYTVYMSWLGIAVAVSSAISSSGVVYTGLVDHHSEKEDFLASLTALFFLLSLITSGLVAVAITVYGAPRVMILPLILQCAADGTVSIYLSEKKHSYSYRSVVLITLAEAVTSPLVSYFLVAICGAGYIGRVLGYLALPLALALVIAVRRVLCGSAFVFSIWKKILFLTLPLLPYSLGGAISSQADKLIIGASLLPPRSGLSPIQPCVLPSTPRSPPRRASHRL